MDWEQVCPLSHHVLFPNVLTTSLPVVASAIAGFKPFSQPKERFAETGGLGGGLPVSVEKYLRRNVTFSARNNLVKNCEGPVAGMGTAVVVCPPTLVEAQKANIKCSLGHPMAGRSPLWGRAR
jgi:hypothetical protein